MEMRMMTIEGRLTTRRAETGTRGASVMTKHRAQMPPKSNTRREIALQGMISSQNRRIHHTSNINTMNRVLPSTGREAALPSIEMRWTVKVETSHSRIINSFKSLMKTA